MIFNSRNTVCIGRMRKILFRDIAAVFTVAAMPLNNVFDDLVILSVPLNATLHSHPTMVILDNDNSEVKTVGNSSRNLIKKKLPKNKRTNTEVLLYGP